jgi:hypothetical protein
MENSKILNDWSAVCEHLSGMKKDVEKNSLKCNVSAGVRLRKNLREIRESLTLLIRDSLAADKEVVQQRKAAKATKTE